MLLHIGWEGWEGLHTAQRSDRKPEAPEDADVLDLVLFLGPLVAHGLLLFGCVFDTPSVLVEALIGCAEDAFADDLGGDIRRKEPVDDAYTVFGMFGGDGDDEAPGPAFAGVATAARSFGRRSGDDSGFGCDGPDLFLGEIDGAPGGVDIAGDSGAEGVVLLAEGDADGIGMEAAIGPDGAHPRERVLHAGLDPVQLQAAVALAPEAVEVMADGDAECVEEVVVEADGVVKQAAIGIVLTVAIGIAVGEGAQHFAILVDCFGDAEAERLQPVAAILAGPDIEVVDIMGDGDLPAIVDGGGPGSLGRDSEDILAELFQQRPGFDDDLVLHHQRNVVEGVAELEVGEVAAGDLDWNFVQVGCVADPAVFELDIGKAGAQQLHAVGLLRGFDAAAANVGDGDLLFLAGGHFRVVHIGLCCGRGTCGQIGAEGADPHQFEGLAAGEFGL